MLEGGQGDWGKKWVEMSLEEEAGAKQRFSIFLKKSQDHFTLWKIIENP